MPNYLCIGVPYFLGERIDGRDEVDLLKASGIADDIGAEWIDLQPDFADDIDPVIAVNRALSDIIANNPDKVPVVFACDCTSSFGMMKGLEAQSPALLWYDAHGDFNTHATTPSGFLGGMPLAMLVGRGQMTYMDGVDLKPMAESDIIITDARDLDPEEGQMLADSDLTHYTEVETLLTAELPKKPIYIHFDTDVVDITEMPGMNYPAPNGPTLDEANATLQRVAKDGEIAGILFSLWDNRHDTDGKSLAAVLQLTRDFVAANT